jgi:hypothetical protein
MPELKARLPQYTNLILNCIESSNTREHLLVCMDFINLFCERFRPILKLEEYTMHTKYLYSHYDTKYKELFLGDEIHA